MFDDSASSLIGSCLPGCLDDGADVSGCDWMEVHVVDSIQNGIIIIFYILRNVFNSTTNGNYYSFISRLMPFILGRQEIRKFNNKYLQIIHKKMKHEIIFKKNHNLIETIELN